MKIINNKMILFLVAVLSLGSLTGCGGGSNDTQETAEEVSTMSAYAPAGWYMKTSVSTTDPATGKVYKHETAGIFGELKQSKDGKDRHDIPAFGSSALQLVFPQNEWGEANGNYFSDYHFYNGGNDNAVWTFQVKSTFKDEITIVLDGTYDVTYLEENGRINYKEAKSPDSSRRDSMTLVDVDMNASYTYDELQNATLKMEGLTTRTFRWIQGSVMQSDFIPLASTSENNTASLQASSKENSKAHPIFGLPPQ